MLLGAAKVIAIDNGKTVPERLRMAADAGAIVVDNRHDDVYDRLLDLTAGLGPDVAIDAVGMEAHGSTPFETVYDKIKTNLMMETERPAVVRQVINCCRKGGTVSIPGVYGGMSDKIPMGALMNKALTIKTGQTHVHRYVPELMDHIRRGRDRSELRRHAPHPAEPGPRATTSSARRWTAASRSSSTRRHDARGPGGRLLNTRDPGLRKEQNMFEQNHYSESTTDAALASGLGWASIAVGLTELAAPRNRSRR